MAFENIGGALAGILKVFIFGLIILIVVGAVVGLLIWSYKRKKWFLKIGVKLPRSGGLVLAEFAKGRYDVKEGIVDIKRKGVKAVGMKPMDIRKYLQGEKYMEVIQLSPTDYIPIISDSYEKVVDEKGNEHATLNIKTDLLKRKTWKNYMERVAKQRFTIAGFLDAHWRAIEISIIVFIIFIGFMALWMRLPSICG